MRSEYQANRELARAATRDNRLYAIGRPIFYRPGPVRRWLTAIESFVRWVTGH